MLAVLEQQAELVQSAEHLSLVQLHLLAVVMAVPPGEHLLDPEVRVGPVVAVEWGQEIILAVQLLHQDKEMRGGLEKPISIMVLEAAEAGLALLVVLMYLE
jgi:hypothetical protein